MRPDTPEIVYIQMALEKFYKAKKLLSEINRDDGPLPSDSDAFQKWIAQLERQQVHSSQKFTIMLLGEYNVGKSTLLNALLDLPKHMRLPSYDRPTNAKPIRLSHLRSGDPEAKIIMSDGSAQTACWKDAVDEAVMSLNGSSAHNNVREVQLFLDQPLLQQADILDMPGTGTAWYKEHTEITHEYISNAEMIIWVIGADEPSGVGWADFNKALRQGVPLTVVFNAWGYLDPQKNKQLNINQDEIEQSVRKNFLDEFNVQEGFRVYARKYLDAQDEGQPVSDQWGISKLRAYIQEEYLGEFLNRSSERRKSVLRQLTRIAREAYEDVSALQARWSQELQNQGEEGRIIETNKRSMLMLELQIRSKIRRQASECAQSLLRQMSLNVENFINDHLTLSNFQVLSRGLTAKGRAELEPILIDILRNDYLHLGAEDNWFHQEVSEFVSECGTILEAEWRRFLNDLSTERFKTRRLLTPPNLPFEKINQAAMRGIGEFVLRLVSVGAVVGILLLVPGSQVISGIVAIGAGIVGFGDPFAKQRKNAIERFKTEIDMQHNGLKKQLVDLVMNDYHAKLRIEFEEKTGNLMAGVQRKVLALEQGLEVINDLSATLSEIISNPAAEEV